MSGRAAVVTQADVARVIRALKATGLTIARVIARPDGVAVETTEAVVSGDNGTETVARKKVVVL
jgi:hypothetical protein